MAARKGTRGTASSARAAARIQERKTVCIMCGAERPGIPVKGDMVLDAIRWFKRNVTRNAKDNLLVVCKDDWPRYNKARKRFMTRRAIYVALGVLFVILVNAVAFTLSTFALTLLVLAFFYLLSLFNYIPALDLGKREAKAPAGAARPPGARRGSGPLGSDAGKAP